MLKRVVQSDEMHTVSPLSRLASFSRAERQASLRRRNHEDVRVVTEAGPEAGTVKGVYKGTLSDGQGEQRVGSANRELETGRGKGAEQPLALPGDWEVNEQYADVLGTSQDQPVHRSTGHANLILPSTFQDPVPLEQRSDSDYGSRNPSPTVPVFSPHSFKSSRPNTPGLLVPVQGFNPGQYYPATLGTAEDMVSQVGDRSTWYSEVPSEPDQVTEPHRVENEEADEFHYSVSRYLGVLQNWMMLIWPLLYRCMATCREHRILSLPHHQSQSNLSNCPGW